MPKGLLLYPPNQLMDVETPRPDGSLGPLYLASALERAGIETDVLDASVGGPGDSLQDTFFRNERQENGLTRIGMSFEAIADFVERGRYDFVGLSSNFTPQTRMAFRAAAAIKARLPSLPIIAGGVNARALRERFLATGHFDGICLTEGELIVPRMVERLLAGRTLDGLPGTAYRADGRTVLTAVDGSCFPSHLDELAMPAWRKLPFEKYEKISSPHGVNVADRGSTRYAPIMTSRGCPFRCTYCHVSAEKEEGSLAGPVGELRSHSIERVVSEIDLLKSLGVGRLYFEDDSLLAEKDRVKEIFRRVRDRRLSIANVNGVNLVHFFKLGAPGPGGRWEIDVEYLEILRDAGFDQIVFPVESGSQRVLRRYATNKVNLDRMDLPRLMKTMSSIGIKAPVNMMLGFPDETEAEIGQSIDLAKALISNGAPYVTFFIPIPFPGSTLYDIAVANGHLSPDFDPDLMNWKRAVMKGTTVPPERLEEIRDRANADINTDLHLKRRLVESMGHRWRANG